MKIFNFQTILVLAGILATQQCRWYNTLCRKHCFFLDRDANTEHQHELPSKGYHAYCLKLLDTNKKKKHPTVARKMAWPANGKYQQLRDIEKILIKLFHCHPKIVRFFFSLSLSLDAMVLLLRPCILHTVGGWETRSECRLENVNSVALTTQMQMRRHEQQKYIANAHTPRLIYL